MYIYYIYNIYTYVCMQTVAHTHYMYIYKYIYIHIFNYISLVIGMKIGGFLHKQN